MDKIFFHFEKTARRRPKNGLQPASFDSLVQCLLDSALDPVVEEAIKGKTGADAEKAIPTLKICGPAVGPFPSRCSTPSHRLARHLSRVPALAQGESEPSPLLYQHALRDVIGRCLYGVDINPMAAELCRVSLWTGHGVIAGTPKMRKLDLFERTTNVDTLHMRRGVPDGSTPGSRIPGACALCKHRHDTCGPDAGISDCARRDRGRVPGIPWRSFR